MLAGMTACGALRGKTEVTTASGASAETTADLYPDDLPDSADMQGQKIRFINGGMQEKAIDIDETESDTGDIINESIWKRNQLLESRFNIDLELTKKSDYGSLNGLVNTFIQANSDDYDIIVGHARFNINIAASGYLKNLNNISPIDLSKSYWSQMYNDEIAYKGIHYWATGDISYGFLSTIYCMFVDSALWSDLYKDKTIYDVVNSGGWTVDVLREYSAGAYLDLNGNSEADDNDTFGFAMQQGHVLNGIAFASGVDYSERDSDGNITITVNNEHTIDVFNKLYNLFYESGNAAYMIPNDKYDATALNMFVDNRLLFFTSTFSTCENEKMRAMETDYYIIPLPKYDESQANYIVNQYDGVPLYGIPITVPLANVDNVGTVMEALASMSSTMVTPVYYDMALKNKYSRDEESANMLDLIHDCVTTDFAFTWGDSVGGMLNLSMIISKNSKFRVRARKTDQGMDKNLEKLTLSLEKERRYVIFRINKKSGASRKTGRAGFLLYP